MEEGRGVGSGWFRSGGWRFEALSVVFAIGRYDTHGFTVILMPSCLESVLGSLYGCALGSQDGCVKETIRKFKTR